MSRAEIDKSPREISITALAKEVDEEATTGQYGVAEIQITRHEVQKGKRDRGGRAYPSIGGDRTEIFDDGSIGDNFAYHYGGRNELQFNLKIRRYDSAWKVRHGVAIRLQPGDSRQRKINKPIRRRVKLFNQYLEAHGERFEGLGMCYSIREDDDKTPSRLFRPHRIPGQLLGEQVTVVLGKREKPSDLTYDDILTLWDNLLPLYKYIEGNLEPEDSFDPDLFSPPADRKNPLQTDVNPVPSAEQLPSEGPDGPENELDPANIEELAAGVDRRAEAGGYAVSNLQEIRMDVKDNGLPDRPEQKPTSDIFRVSDFNDDFAFHCGGRDELQFNLAIRRYAGEWKVRHGVAFHYELGSRMESLLPLRARIGYFNEYLYANQEEFTGMKLWYEPKGSSVPNEDLRRKQIPESLVEEGYGFFLGRRTKPSELTYDDILTRFDRLLPLYEYIEENLDAEEFPNGNGSTGSSQGATNSDRKYQTTAEQSKTKVDIDLRHNRMQDVLETELAAKHGTENIHAEAPTEQGRSVDLVVQTEDGKWFYEIKPFNDPRLCFRKAVGQLLEYAYWSRSEVPERLIVVGRSELGEEGEAYLSTLKEQFSLPLEYQSLQVPVASS